MVIVIGGPNLFACDKRFQDALKDNPHISVELSEQDSIVKLQEALQGDSLFGSNDYVVARGVDSLNKADTEKMVEVASNTPKDTVLIVFVAGLGKSITNKFKNVADIVHFEENLKAYQLIDWVVDYSRQKGGSIDKSTARYLAEWVGDNQLTLSGEIEKLINFSKKITKDNIDSVATKTPQATIFQMLDAMLKGDSTGAINLYKELLSQKLDPSYIVSMICWQANALTVAHAAHGKDLDRVGADTGISPFVLKKSWSIARKLSKNEVIAINEQILSLDEQIKSAPLDVERSVEQLIRKLSTSL